NVGADEPTFSRAQLIIAVDVCGAVFRGQFLPGAHERCVETLVAGRADRGVDSRYFNSVRRNLLALRPLFPLPAHTWHGVGKHRGDFRYRGLRGHSISTGLELWRGDGTGRLRAGDRRYLLCF